MGNASNVQKFIAKMERLQMLIDNADSGIIANGLPRNKDTISELSIPQSSDAVQNSSFRIGIDSWGTSPKKVGK